MTIGPADFVGRGPTRLWRAAAPARPVPIVVSFYFRTMKTARAMDITVGHNRIGGSICGPAFTGMISSIELPDLPHQKTASPPEHPPTPP